MKKKIKFKYPFYIILLSFIPALLLISGLNIDKKENKSPNLKKEQIVDSYPVINEDNKIGMPYENDKVKIGKNFYDYKSESSTQENSITVHDNTYYQNTGIDYICEEEFDVLSILDGTVISVKEDENLGKIIEIKHDNELISVYQSLSETTVKKDDIVTKGQIIGKSGKNEMDKDLGNHLHLEIYENGQAVNPEGYLGKEYEKKN